MSDVVIWLFADGDLKSMFGFLNRSYSIYNWVKKIYKKCK